MVVLISRFSDARCRDISDSRDSIMVRAQMLSELEEIIAYKQYADQPERQTTMRRTWMRRCDYSIRRIRLC